MTECLRTRAMSVHACQVASVVSDSVQPYGQQPARLLCPWALGAFKLSQCFSIGVHTQLHQNFLEVIF